MPCWCSVTSLSLFDLFTPPPHKMTQLVKTWWAADLVWFFFLALPTPEPQQWMTRNTVISPNWYYPLYSYNNIFHGLVWSHTGAFIIYVSKWRVIRLYHFTVSISISKHPQMSGQTSPPADTLNRAISGLCYICRLIAGPVKPPYLTSCYVGHWSLQLATATWCQHLVSGLWQRSWASCPFYLTPVSLTPNIQTPGTV